MTADPLRHPRLELLAAEKAIEGMRAARSLDDFESEWRAYLNAIEKAWQKVERCCQHNRSSFEPWQGNFHRLRKKDMLLRYLKQARDADNHSIQDITKIEPGRRTIRFANPRRGYIKRLELRNGEITHYEGDPVIVEDISPHPTAVPVKNNGEWFNPPSSHLGQPVTNHHPVLLAELGLEFYRRFVDEVQKLFFTFEE